MPNSSHYVEHLPEWQSPSKKQKLMTQIQQFTTKNYKPIKNVNLSEDLGGSHPNRRRITTQLVGKQNEVVDLLLTDEVWGILVDETNQELALKASISTSKSRESTYRQTNMTELKLTFFFNFSH